MLSRFATKKQRIAATLSKQINQIHGAQQAVLGMRSMHSAVVVASNVPLTPSSTHINPPPPPPKSNSSSFFRLLAFAVGGTVLYGVWDYFSVRSSSNSSLSARLGYPLDLMLLLQSARQCSKKAERDLEKWQKKVSKVREKRRLWKARKEAEKKAKEEAEAAAAAGGGAGAEATHTSTITTLDAPPLQNDLLIDSAVDLPVDPPAPVDLPSELRLISPSLMEAERIYRDLLSKLHVSLLSASEIEALAASASSAPDILSSQSVSASLSSLLSYSDSQRIDRKFVPHVLSLLAQVVQIQASIARDMEELSDISATQPFRPKPTSPASELFRKSEQLTLHALMLYGKFFAHDGGAHHYPTITMQQYGKLLFDWGRTLESKALWIRCIHQLDETDKRNEEENKSIVAAVAQQSNDEDDEDRSVELDILFNARLSLPMSCSLLRSEVCENLSLVSRVRGEFLEAVQWDQESLRQWDQYASFYKRIAQGGPTNLPQGNKPRASTPLDLALYPLPRALHLLNALVADLYAAGENDAAFNHAQKALEVVERMVQLRRVQQQGSAVDRTEKFEEFVEALAPLVFQLYQPSSVVDPQNIKEEVAATFYNLAVILNQQKKADEARVWMRIARHVRKL